MPRIRKETSNRKKTNDRAKLSKKVREGRKKNAKAAKKNVQWKSKTPKDPGIPNEFPYKDQILAEVAEQRRLAAEDKERKKQEKQRALAKTRAIARGEPFEDSEEENDREAEGAEDEDEMAVSKGKGLNVGAESIASLSAKLVNAQLKPRPRPAAEVEEEDEEDEEEVPVLINRDLPNLKTVLDKADVVLEVLDARDPLAFRSQHIEELVSGMGKKLLFVVNKIDTCPREAVASWTQHLISQHPTVLFRSATCFLPAPSTPEPQIKKGKGKSKVPVDDALGADSLLACFAHLAREKKGDEPLAVAVIGVTNVGKSSLINSLLKRAALPIYTLASSSRGPTTTELPQEVTLDVEDQKITLIDTPGLSFTSNEDIDSSLLEERRARDILLRSKGRIDRLKDPNPPIVHIVSRANAEDLMLLYSLPAFAKGDPTAFLSGVARANQLVKKKGEPDLTGAARIVLRDWSIGKLSHYATPPTTSTSTPTVIPGTAESSSKSQLADAESFITQLYTKHEAILAGLPTRKEKRKQGGLVKLSSGVVDDRKTALEEDWAGLEDSEDEESDVDEPTGLDVEGMDVDEAEEDEEEENEEESDEGQESDKEDEEEMTPPPISKKHKRKRAVEMSAPERPSKKVAFTPPSSKRSQLDSKRAGKHSPIRTAQQKPLKSAQVPSKKLDSKPQDKPVPKPKISPSKVSAGSAAVKTASDTKGKVANVSTKKTKGPLAPIVQKNGSNGPEAYDFGKFF
ncbi:hypothetical protein GALMADRAFT_250307 [Galerina marginata CBS 339.88]|uniref:CP-type G domain-containing protein n=1 Tax=Galerina marginata (strain CBS 339.88) TaxID=685588 RepID=A0A067SU28_GALM3|nr:hypothetical protein GALMADRAFT_250307 [Galerina marginata CBS 339.88]